MRVCTGGSRLMGISLLRFPLLQYFKKFHKYLPNANFHFLITAFIWLFLAQNRNIEIDSLKFA